MSETQATDAQTWEQADTGGSQTRAQAIQPCCPIVELRQYTLHPGRRDEFIALFDEHFIEEQERYGMHILGQFRDRTHPDHVVWLRGFHNMETRQRALEGFYHASPLWQELRAATNDTISDVSNVLLLKPARATSGFCVDPETRPARDAQEVAGGLIIATIYALVAPVEAQLIEWFEKELAPLLRESGATLLGYFVTEPSENTYPALPVREGEQVFAWFASFVDEAVYRAHRAALAQNQEGNTSRVSGMPGWLSKPEEILELAPTRRSLIRCGSAEGSGEATG